MAETAQLEITYSVDHSSLPELCTGQSRQSLVQQPNLHARKLHVFQIETTSHMPRSPPFRPIRTPCPTLQVAFQIIPCPLSSSGVATKQFFLF